MKYFIFFIFFLTLCHAGQAQRRNIPLNQIDNRFTIRAETNTISFVHDEYYYFYVKNNTNQTYQLVVDITVYSPCFETRTYKLGFNRVVYLKPGEEFNPSKDYYHIFNGDQSKKDCRIKVGDKYTYISQIQYSYSDIRNITQEEAEKEKEKAAKEKERLEKETRDKEEKERARLEKEAQLKQAEEQKKLKLEEEKRIALQKKEDEKTAQQNSAAQNSSINNTGDFRNDSSSTNNSNKVIPHQASHDDLPDLVRTKDGGYFQRGNDGNFREINQDDYYREKNKSKNVQAEQIGSNTQQEVENSVKAQQEANRRQQQRWQEDFQAQMEKNRIDQQNLEAAGVSAANQIASGNYQQAGITYGTELAKQGYGEAALVSLGVGTAAQIISSGIKEKRQREEAEARRLERERIQQQREREKQELLQRQKIQFEKMVAGHREAKKSIISSRTTFLSKEETYTKTFDKFSQSGEPIYIFFVEANNDYKSYNEHVSFPNQIDIRINENVNLNFSPILTIYPNSSGEYPYLADIFGKIKTDFIQKSGTTYKIYNWSSSLEEAQEHYKAISQQAISSQFIPVFPENFLTDFNETSRENSLYWNTGQENASTVTDSISSKALNYWNLSKSSNDTPLTKAGNEKTDYWKTEVKKDSLDIAKPDEKNINYWNLKKD